MLNVSSACKKGTITTLEAANTVELANEHAHRRGHNKYNTDMKLEIKASTEFLRNTYLSRFLHAQTIYPYTIIIILRFFSLDIYMVAEKNDKMRLVTYGAMI